MTAFALSAVLAFLSALHIYWAFGGRWGWGAAIPQIDGRPAFTPSRFATVLVAFAINAMRGVKNKSRRSIGRSTSSLIEAPPCLLE